MPAQVGRAELLRALSLGRAGPLALDHTDAVWWGYVPPEADAIVVEDVGQTLELPFRAHEPPATSTPSPARARSALRMPEAWVAERLDGGSGELPDPPERSIVLTEVELQPPDEPQAAYRDLLPLPRLAQPLAAQLRRPQAAGVNVAALLQASTRRQWPRRLPRIARQTWPATLVVMLDVSTDLFPYRYDMYRVVALLQALVPRAQLRVMTGEHGPLGPWQPLHRQAALADTDDGVRPESGCTYLLVSDLGLLRPASEVAQAWKAWLAGVQVRQCACVALAPVGADDVGSTLAAFVTLLRWSPDSRLQPERGRPDTDVAAAESSSESALRELLACLSATLRMDPPLLRALRQNSSAPQDASLEGRLWAHPDVLSTTYACLRQSRIEFHQAASRLQTGARWSTLEKTCDFHHTHWPLGMRLVEGMRQLTTRPVLDSTSLERMHAEIYRLAHSLNVDEGNRATLDAIADYVLSRVPAEARPLLGTALDALAQATGRPIGPRQRWCLLQRGQQLCIVPATDTRPPGPGVVLCGDLGQAAPGELVRITQPLKPPQYLALPVEGMLALPMMKVGAGIVLGGEETQLLRRQRTRGVWGWAQTDAGLIEMLGSTWLNGLRVPGEGMPRSVAMVGSRSSEPVALAVGCDEYGIYLLMQPQVLLHRGLPESMFLRFRYLEPASYLQGSPQFIGYNDEHPQHLVTLSRGLWLAETPCTQALWQAVMGNNPSHFKQSEDSPRRPAEQVSWDEVQTFLNALQRLLPPGCEAVLPTESQWEYACRAGTQTEYWWGDEPDNVRANWYEQHKCTTPVDRYPPNPWGLYDMHGNVWEWCADGQRGYAAEPARDPEGPGAGEARVVRGGSWIDHASYARAAFRRRRPRGSAYQHFGFRFALRSPVEADAPAAEPLRRDADDASSSE
ncbi:MAG: SUMF1/EgtB/PvdO family nonheme iron enzyme [Pseudomonadota bacterium]